MAFAVATKNAQLTTSQALERRDHSPAQTWLSLAKLLPSRASLRFTKHHDPNQNRRQIKIRQTRTPGLANSNTIGNNAQTFTTVHLLILTRPSLAGFNAPSDTKPQTPVLG